jgi:hypothetical protein
MIVTMQQSPIIHLPSNMVSSCLYNKQMSDAHLNELLRVGGNLARVSACLTALENQARVVHTRKSLLKELRLRDCEEVSPSVCGR